MMSDSALLAETKSNNIWRKRAEAAEARAAALDQELKLVLDELVFFRSSFPNAARRWQDILKKKMEQLT